MKNKYVKIFNNQKFLIILLLLIFIIFTCYSDNEDNSSLFLKLKNSRFDFPININNKINEVPAGKYGFLKVKNSNFTFENSNKIMRFYGTNICYDACFPNKEQATKIANRIASLGFNAVRFHHMDSFAAPKGIFKDNTLTELSEEQLDKLDYFIYSLKEKGIHININLLVNRDFENNPNVDENKKVRRASKPFSLFDYKIIDEQKKYAKALLTHFNPYTKMKYVDDPSIILVELINETSIMKNFLNDKLHFNNNENGLPEHYSALLDLKWRKWLIQKHSEIPYFKRPRFNKYIAHSYSNFNLLNEFYTSIQKEYFDKMKIYLQDNLEVKVPIIGIGGFLVNEDLPTMINMDVLDLHYYIDHPKFQKGKLWDKNTFTIEPKSNIPEKLKDYSDKLLSLEIYQKAVTITEWNHCYPSPFAYETPLLFAYISSKNGVDAIFQFAFMHTLELLEKEPVLESFFDLYNNPQQLVLHMIASRIFYSNENFKFKFDNNSYLIEGTSLLALVGNIKNKSIIYDNINYTPQSDGVFLINKINEKENIISAFSEIKNSNSFFNNNNTFNWGLPPIMLKLLPYTITLDKNSKISISSFNNDLKIKDISLNSKNNNKIKTYYITNNPFIIIKKE